MTDYDRLRCAAGEHRVTETSLDTDLICTTRCGVCHEVVSRRAIGHLYQSLLDALAVQQDELPPLSKTHSSRPRALDGMIDKYDRLCERSKRDTVPARPSRKVG